MSPQFVDAVWVWRFNSSAFKATYGRMSAPAGEKGDDSYSKDYLQVSGKCGDLLSQKFGIAREPSSRVNITFEWPGGQAQGFLSFSSDRFHVAWPMNSAPAPWKVAQAPSDTTPHTIPGDPAHTTQAEATKEWESLDGKGLEPYLIAVKLRGQSDRLHLRAYLGNPPQGMDWAAMALAPQAVKELAEGMRANGGCASLEVTGGMTAETDVADLLSKLDDSPNVLLVGPPGTGKTVLLERLTRYVEHNFGGLLFDPQLNHSAWSENSGGFPGMARMVVLHPAYSYDNLVLGLLPEPVGGALGVRAVPGPLVNLAKFASLGENRALLVLDEFNRGNAAAVLGDALALLDKDKRGVAYIDLPYSNLNIEVPDEFAAGQDKKVSGHFTLPPNLWIVAAMNSSDRSVAPLDAALRRRFTIVEMPPDYEVLQQRLEAEEAPDFEAHLDDWTPARVGALAVNLLRSLNARIDAVLGSDFRLGQSNFWSVQGETAEERVLSLSAAFDFRVVPTLRLSMQDDDGALAAVLRAGTAESPRSGSTIAAYWMKADPSLGSYASDRLHFRRLSDLKNREESLAELIRQADL